METGKPASSGRVTSWLVGAASALLAFAGCNAAPADETGHLGEVAQSSGGYKQATTAAIPGAMNSCYVASDAVNFLKRSICLEQAGSYPAACCNTVDCDLEMGVADHVT